MDEEDSDDDEEPQNIVQAINDQQRDHVHHEAISVLSQRKPFVNNKTHQQFSAVLAKVVAEDITPCYCKLTADEWEGNEYPIFETIPVGRRGSKELYVSLAESIWFKSFLLLPPEVTVFLHPLPLTTDFMDPAGESDATNRYIYCRGVDANSQPCDCEEFFAKSQDKGHCVECGHGRSKHPHKYYQCKGPFAGGQANGKDWWENLPISAKTYPLKTLVITLFLIVPHAADVEQLFSDLSGIQNVKHCNLTVRTFKTLGKLHNNYSYHVYQCALAAGQPVRQKHAHMHTQNNGGIDMDLAMNLDTNFAWTPPLVSQSQADDKLEGPESLTEDEVAVAFDEIEQCIAELPSVIDPQLEGYEILVGKVYDLAELEQVDKGIMPAAFEDDVQQVGFDLEDNISWDVQSLLTIKGVLSM
ncbi:hypothetical protein BDR04DRAFT_1158485 [Suillus decipiens]|nr:hypothetical protein BDR04DRAFT_1158485 [Suillus decipiens]